MNNISMLTTAILKAGLLVGALDAMAASVHAYLANGATPARVFRYVASGALGKAAFTGSSWIIAAGLFFHFTIAMAWTALFFILYPKVTALSKNYVLTGIVYGLIIWLTMNFVVIPLSQITRPPLRLISALPQIFIHLFLIGLSISYLANRYYSKS